MHRFYEFLRRHGPWVDGVLGLVLLTPTLIWLAHGTGSVSRPAGLVVAVLMYLVIALRRVAPEKMLLLAIGTGLLQLILDSPPSPANVGFLMIVCTVASRNTRWASRLALGASLLAPTVSSLRWPSGPEQSGIGVAVFNTLLLTVCFALAWVIGDLLRIRRAYYAELEERAARLEREREAESRMAVAAERARIARELHDVVAHNVSVMVVQADGGAYVLDSAPDQTRTALRTISNTGRQALTEMRRLLGVLRDDESGAGDDPHGTGAAPGGGDWVPQPGLEELTELVEQARQTGMSVNLRYAGVPRRLPSGVELTAYRIVQEALTNSRKHGGSGVAATVLLDYGDTELTVQAEDDGDGPQRELLDPNTERRGHGLIGMRERVGMVGGELDAGPLAAGGFRIKAALPLPGECRTASEEPPTEGPLAEEPPADGSAPVGTGPHGTASEGTAPHGAEVSADPSGAAAVDGGADTATPTGATPVGAFERAAPTGPDQGGDRPPPAGPGEGSPAPVSPAADRPPPTPPVASGPRQPSR